MLQARIWDGLRSRMDRPKATEAGVAVHALNRRMLALDRPTYVGTAQPQTGLKSLHPCF